MEKALHDLPEPVLPDPRLEDTAVKQQDEMEIDFTGMGKKGFTNTVGNPVVVDDIAELPGLRHNCEVSNRHVDNQGQAVLSPPLAATGEWPRRVSLQEATACANVGGSERPWDLSFLYQRPGTQTLLRIVSKSHSSSFPAATT